MERPQPNTPLNAQRHLALSDESQIGEARRSALQAAMRAGCGETERGKVSIIASELARNVIRHAKGGDILIGPGIDRTEKTVEIIAMDRGPGMADVQRCLTDGYSTGGTLGQGLGAVRRLSSDFDIYSRPGGGTVVFSRVAVEDRGSRPERKRCQWSAVCIPAPGESECGDGWRAALDHPALTAIVVDGLGHGPVAALAAAHAMDVFDLAPFDTPGVYLKKAHESLRSTRGAAAAAARIDLERRMLVYAGVGNISGSIIADHAKSRSLTSHNGTIGVQLRKVQEFEYPLPDQGLLIMHSDGVQTRWDLANYPGLSARHPAVVAAVLYRDFRRGKDDATILVVRTA